MYGLHQDHRRDRASGRESSVDCPVCEEGSQELEAPTSRALRGTRESSILEVGKGGLPPLFRMARFEVAGASHPSLPLIFIDMRSMLWLGNQSLRNRKHYGSERT